MRDTERFIHLIRSSSIDLRSGTQFRQSISNNLDGKYLFPRKLTSLVVKESLVFSL